VPVRNASIGWRQLMNHYKEQMLACDFFTVAVETIRLKTLYVFFFIELGTRRIHLAGITINPDSGWTAQQARQLVRQLEENESDFRFLLRDRGSNVLDPIFESEEIHVTPTPIRAPNANAFTERWVRTVRRDSLNHFLIVNQYQLKRIVTAYTEYYNQHRAHQGIQQRIPTKLNQPRPRLSNQRGGRVIASPKLNGLHHSYAYAY